MPRALIRHQRHAFFVGLGQGNEENFRVMISLTGVSLSDLPLSATFLA
jgi:hypothetical protein